MYQDAASKSSSSVYYNNEAFAQEESKPKVTECQYGHQLNQSNEPETKTKHLESHYKQQATGIDIPTSSNSRDIFYSQMSPQYQEFYSDILSFTSDSSLLDVYPVAQSSINSNASSTRDNIDPMNDPQFMAFLSSLSTAESTPPSSEGSLLLLPELDVGQEESSAPKAKTTAINSSSKRMKTIKKRMSVSNTRLGKCEHPKHCLYRQEKYILSTHGPFAVDETTTVTAIQSIPRRGRPPKGSKATEFVYSTSPIPSNNADVDDNAVVETFPIADNTTTAVPTATTPYYPMVELTVRPLPKRLEAVVGKSNIKVCLTCLKRSDMDPAYLQDQAYVGPQSLSKRKKQ